MRALHAIWRGVHTTVILSHATTVLIEFARTKEIQRQADNAAHARRKSEKDERNWKTILCSNGIRSPSLSSASSVRSLSASVQALDSDCEDQGNPEVIKMKVMEN